MPRARSRHRPGSVQNWPHRLKRPCSWAHRDSIAPPRSTSARVGRRFMFFSSCFISTVHLRFTASSIRRRRREARTRGCFRTGRWSGRSRRSNHRDEAKPISARRRRRQQNRAQGRAWHTQSDLLVINKTDFAAGVGADLDVMAHDSKKMRGSGPFIFAQVKHGVGVHEIIAHLLHDWQHATGVAHQH